jgi:DNA primase
VSAIKLAPYYDTMALLGTNLSEAKVNEIVEHGAHYENIWLCLDNDATGESIKLVLKWRDWLKTLRVRGLEKDIKDMTDTELDTFMVSLQ